MTSRKNPNPGRVLWITGLSGSGKTTLASWIVSRAAEQGHSITFVDGDLVREIMGNDLGHDPNDRLKNAYRISRLCAFLSQQGHDVACATMSLFDEIHQWNRDNLPKYTEVYLKAEMPVLQTRDPKGIYREAKDGSRSGVVGVDLEFREPKAPDFVFENNGDLESLYTFGQSLMQTTLEL